MKTTLIILLSITCWFFSAIINPVNAQTVNIGKQVWMTQNLNVTQYRNGDPIPEVENDKEWNKTTTGAWCFYENAGENGTTYGILYNWYAVHDKRGIAPAGFHIPSDGELTTLINYLGGEKKAGGKLKEEGTKHWKKPNVKATNSNGFSALPAGSRNNDGSFSNISSTTFWTSTESTEAKAWCYYISFDWGNVIRTSKLKNNGFSVRCIQDKPTK